MPQMHAVEEADGDDTRRIVEGQGFDTVEDLHRRQASRTTAPGAWDTIAPWGARQRTERRDAGARRSRAAGAARGRGRPARGRLSGEPPPLPKASWWPRIVAALVVVILLGFVMLATFGSNPPY